MCSDEFFAEAKNLISLGKPVRREGVFVESGAWLVEFLFFFWDGGGGFWGRGGRGERGEGGRCVFACLTLGGWVAAHESVYSYLSLHLSAYLSVHLHNCIHPSIFLSFCASGSVLAGIVSLLYFHSTVYGIRRIHTSPDIKLTYDIGTMDGKPAATTRTHPTMSSYVSAQPLAA